MTGAERIVDFAADVVRNGVPDPVLGAARLHLLDALGVGIAASTVYGPIGWSSAAPPGAACLLSGGTAEPGAAAMVNGALIHALEFDDTHIASVVHGSAVAAPLALSVTQMTDASGRDLICSYIITWEVMIRLGLAAPGAFQARGFQVTSVAGALGAAAAASTAMDLGRTHSLSAIGIAGGQASGTFGFLADGATSKALNPGWAARTGIEAARLAQAGMTGPTSILESHYGIMSVFAGGSDKLDEQLSSLGVDWHLPEAAFKLYPCCHYIHPFLECMEQLMAEGLRPDDVIELTAIVPPPMAPLICEPWERRQQPASGYDGKWGLAYCMALMLLDGRVGVDSFQAEPRREVIAMAKRMSWRPMEDGGFPERFSARIEVVTPNGRRNADVTQVRGAPDRPVPAEDIRAKFASNATRRFSATEAVQLEDLVMTMETKRDFAALSRLLAG